MKEYFKLPIWLESWNEINSRNISEFKQGFDSKSKEIDLKFLRNYYKDNQSNFYNLIDEMALRGIEFHSLKSNNTLPSKRYDESCRFILSNKESQYSNIDFEKFMLGNIIRRFNVDNSNFFDYIPLEGFMHLNPKVDLKKLEDEFIQNLFEISTYSMKSNKCIHNGDDEVNSSDNNKGIIKKYFYDNCFNIMIKHLDDAGVFYIEDLTEENIKECLSLQGIGISKLKKYRKRFIEIQNLNKFTLQFDFNKVEFWFSESDFIEYCKDNEIKYCYELNEDILLRYFEISYVTYRIQEKLLDEYKEYTICKDLCYEESLSLENENKLLEDIFEKSFNEITNQDYIALCNTKGVGKGKIDNVKEALIQNYLTIKEEDRCIDILKIEFWFADKIFDDFNEFCKEKELSSMFELGESNIQEFSIEYKRTKPYLKKLRDIIDEFYKKIDGKIAKPDKEININDYWLNKFREVKVVDLLEGLNMPFIDHDLELTIGDINGTCLDKSIEDYSNILSLTALLTDTLNIRELFNIVEEMFKGSNVIEILNERYISGKTLKELGEIYNVTRERIRQLQNKTEDKILDYLDLNNFMMILTLEFWGRNYCALKELIDLVGKEKYYLIKMLISTNKKEKLYYLDSLKILYFKDHKHIKDEIEKIHGQLPDFFKLCDRVEEIEECFRKINIKDSNIEKVESWLTQSGYRIYGEYCSKSKITNTKMAEVLFKEYITKPLKMDEEGYKLIEGLALKYLNCSFNSKARSLENRIRDNDDIMLTDRLTFLHIDYLDIDLGIVDIIDKKLSEAFETEEMITADYLFKSNEDEFIKYNLNNKYIMYSISKYYLGEKFKFGCGNTLSILKNENITYMTKDERLVKALNENNGILSKEELLVRFNWNEMDLENTISKSNEVIKINQDVVTVERLNITEEERNEIEKIVQALMKKSGYTSGYKILKEMRFNITASGFINRNKITSKSDISSLIRALFSYAKGRRNIIFDNRVASEVTIMDIVNNEFKGVIENSIVKDFIMDYGYSSVVANSIMKNLLKEDYFMEISYEEYINTDSFEIDDEVSKEVVEYMNDKFDGKEYLVLSKLKGYKRKLPMFEHTWNEYLIRSVLCRNGFRGIRRVFGDNSNEIVIVVHEESNIESYEDLIYHIIDKEYEGNMTETLIYDYLTEVGVVREQEYTFDKNIPYDLKVSGRIKIDEVGRVELI